jgi:hypothetical protein
VRGQRRRRHRGLPAVHDAGFTHLALVQIGGDQQQPYLDWAASRLLPALREAFG